MEPEMKQPQGTVINTPSQLNRVTPLSKYLAMALFIAMPFIGGYIGYAFAPEKVVEVEKEVIREVEKDVLVEETSEIAFPVVAFEREGLLSYEEKIQLSEKFVEPYVDYHQMLSNNNILTIVIEVPQELGEPYVIRNVTTDGNAGGFLFGERGGEYDYWVPGCFGECEFTDEFTEKHPQVVEQYR